MGRHDTGRRGVGGQVAQGLEHLRRARGAVQADDVDVHGLEGDEGGTHLGAGEHRPRQLDGHLALDRQAHPGPPHGPPGAVDGRLGLEEVEHRLHQDQVGTPFDEGGRLLVVGVPQVGVAGLAERRELGAGADAAGHPAGLVRGRVVVGRPPGQGHGGEVELADPVHPGRTRRAPGRRRRRCRSPRRRSPPRRTTGGPVRRRRAGSRPAARCTPPARARRSPRRSAPAPGGWSPWRRRTRRPARVRPGG